MRNLAASALLLLTACATTTTAPPSTAPHTGTSKYDVVLRNATLYDGSGGAAVHGDLAIRGDRIAAVGKVTGQGAQELDVHGLAVAPGFINVMSQAQESLIADGRGLSDTKQGVTTEIMGEGESMGPLSPAMKQEFAVYQADIKYPVEWTTLREYLDWLVRRAPLPAELEQMQALVRQAMKDGAFGVASALIYAPGAYANMDELIALASASGPNGMYISHMRSEGNRLVGAVDELITIARQAHVPAEIYHLKAAGQQNWLKMDEVIRHVNAARAEGLQITADMYTYTAGETGLDAAMPPWVQAGGYEAWRKRLQDPDTRRKVIEEMRTPSDAWENLMRLTGSPERVLLVGFKSDALKPLTGKTLAEVAKMRGVSPEDAAIDLVIEDGSRITTIYFLMSEDNLRKQIAQPWVSFGSDAESSAPEGSSSSRRRTPAPSATSPTSSATSYATST
jgi:N-acyl-D-amino-acid deacylase